MLILNPSRTQHSLATPQFAETLSKTDLNTIIEFKEGNRIHLDFTKQ